MGKHHFCFAFRRTNRLDNSVCVALPHSLVEMVLAVCSRFPADWQKVAPAFSNPPSTDMTAEVEVRQEHTINTTSKPRFSL